MRGIWLFLVLLWPSTIYAQETWTSAVLAAPTAAPPASTDALALIQGARTVQLTIAALRQAFGISSTSPAVASGGCTGGTGNVLTAANGSAAFAVTVGALPCASAIVLTMPASSNGWVCDAHDITAPDFNDVEMTKGSATSVTLTAYARGTNALKAFTQNDVIAIKCAGY